MNLLNIIRKTLNEEVLPEGKTGILLLDIDDTLLKSDSRDIKIYRKLPTDKVEVPLTSAEYAKEHVTKDTKKYYDYRDFRDPQKVYNSIANGAPLLNNLKVVDAFYNGGYDIGILTARGCADAVRRAVRAFLKVKDSKGNLVPLRISAANIHCVNDDDYPYPGDTDFQKKQNVLRKYAKQYNYDYVYFIDDDVKNLNALKALKKSDPDIASRLRSIDAKKNMRNPIKEDVLNEFAWDKEKHGHQVREGKVSNEVLEAINDGDLKKGLVLYFNIVKNQPVYAGKKDAASALRHMIAYGMPKAFVVYEKNGSMYGATVNELKEYGLKHLNEIAKEVEYQGNDDYVAPKWAKKTLRKKFMAKSLEELKKMIEEAKGKGYVFKDSPKEGHTAKDGDFVYAYGTINKEVNESVNLGLHLLLTEMAKTDITQNIKKAIEKGDYKTAIIDYFNNVKNGKAYEKFNGDIGAIYDRMRAYGLSRTFGTEEKAKSFPEGTTDALKKFAEEHRKEILAELGDDKPSEALTPKQYREGLKDSGADVSKWATEKQIKDMAKSKKAEKIASYSDDDAGNLRKISDRINKYKKIISDLDTYASKKSVAPFIIDMRKHGEDGSDPTLAPSVVGALKDPERYTYPILDFRKRMIPEFIQKEALKKVSGDLKKDLEKAETRGTIYFEATKNKIFTKYLSRVLNNIIQGFEEFKKENAGKEMSDKELLSAMKQQFDWYDSFVKLEKHYKENKIKNDKEDFELGIRKRADVKVSEEVDRVRKEYIEYLNSLEKAAAEGKVGEFFRTPANYAIARTSITDALESDSKMFSDNLIQRWMNSDLSSAKELSPSLRKIYNQRKDESMDINFAKNYQELASTLAKMMPEFNKAYKSGNKDEIERIEFELEKLTNKIIRVIIDRLIAVDMISMSANSAILNNFEKAAERHEKIKAELLKKYPEKYSFKSDSPEYKEYYDPQGDEEEKAEAKKQEEQSKEDLYNSVIKAVKAIPSSEIMKYGIMVPAGINIPQRRYTEDEFKKFAEVLKSPDGAKKLCELLATPEFKGIRQKRD